MEAVRRTAWSLTVETNKRTIQKSGEDMDDLADVLNALFDADLLDYECVDPEDEDGDPDGEPVDGGDDDDLIALDDLHDAAPTKPEPGPLDG